MLAYRLTEEFNREKFARAALKDYASYAAFISRLGGSQRFELIIPLRSPQRRHAMRRILAQRSVFNHEFELIDLQGFNSDGAIWTRVDETEADAIAKRDDYVTRVDTAPADDWLSAD